jgi:hypothetical protein
MIGWMRGAQKISKDLPPTQATPLKKNGIKLGSFQLFRFTDIPRSYVLRRDRYSLL